MSSITRKLGFSFVLAVAACAGDHEEGDEAASQAALTACGLNDGTVEKHARLGACDPSDTKKTTICHVPPGNPANAHTICIGNAAVQHHLKNHADYLGACKVEVPCGGDAGAPGGSGGSTTNGGSGGEAAGGSVGIGGSGGAATGGTGGRYIP